MPSRPNILWYCTDQQRFDTIAALGNAHINTPNLDRFVAESAVFTHAFCQSPICSPSRASFLTGMYPSAVGVNGNGFRRFPRHFEDRLITKALRDAGYDCGLIGKLHLASAFLRREERVNDGYDYLSIQPRPQRRQRARKRICRMDQGARHRSQHCAAAARHRLA